MWKIKVFRWIARSVLRYLIYRIPVEDLLEIWYGDDEKIGYANLAELTEAVRKRAYKLWVEDGEPKGQDLNYWTAAEEEIFDDI
jgi:hypothetical protein